MSDPIHMVCVSHRSDVFDRYLGASPHLDPSQLIRYDNRYDNVPIPVRYNHFIEHLMGDGWVVFAHHDMQFEEPLGPVLDATPTDAIYGVCGARRIPARRIPGGRRRSVELVGRIKCLPHIDPSGHVGIRADDLADVDTVDCCCVVVHSSLIRQHGLRFDEVFAWHFYSEDFSLRARRDYRVPTRVLQLECGHYGHGFLSDDFHASKKALLQRHGSDTFASTCYAPPLAFSSRLRERTLRMLRR